MLSLEAISWLNVFLVSFSQALPHGMNFVIFNLPDDRVVDFIKTSKTNNLTLLEKEQLFVNQIFNNETLKIYSAIVSIYFIGCCLGSGLGGYLQDKKGLKFTMLLETLLLIFSCLTMYYSVNFIDNQLSYYIVIICRFLVGLHGGSMNTILPIYLSCYGVKEHRSYYNTMLNIMQRTGQLIVGCLGMQIVLGSESLWRYITLRLVVLRLFRIC